MLKIGSEFEQLLKSLFKPTILYNNEEGTNENVPLNDEPTKFRDIEIFFYSFASSTRRYSSVKAHMPLTERIMLQSTIIANTTYVVGVSADYKVSGSSLTKLSNNTVVLAGGTGSTTNEIFITRVIGYK